MTTIESKHKYTADDLLCKGLRIVGVSQEKIDRAKIRKTNVARYRSEYGADPSVHAKLWIDLMTTDNPKAKIDPKLCKLSMFFMSLNFLRRYSTETEQANTFDKSENTIRKWRWFFVHKIAALKGALIVWPTEWTTQNPNLSTLVPTILITVDGVHFRCNEPKHKDYSKNTKYYSHKFATAAFNYEIAIDIARSRVVHVAGPFPASKHDITIFRGELKDKVPDGKFVIGDKGYRGEADKVMTPNAHDFKAVRDFKGRARARHESFNKRMKNYKVMDNRFIHGEDLHKVCFDAVLVLSQYQMDMGEPLFDI
jgi:hypothetical protein